MESPQLSLGFIRGPPSRSRQLLVCGVLDDAHDAGSGELKTFGALTVKAESEAVRRGSPWFLRREMGYGYPNILKLPVIAGGGCYYNLS